MQCNKTVTTKAQKAAALTAAFLFSMGVGSVAVPPAHADVFGTVTDTTKVPAPPASFARPPEFAPPIRRDAIIPIREQVFLEAQKYIGIPYRAYGYTPETGFDCSGFTMYVYGLYGVSLPHLASAQAALGTEVPESEALPGDLVLMPGHIGFWVSPGRMLDSPTEGKSIGIRKIWASSYTIYRVAS